MATKTAGVAVVPLKTMEKWCKNKPPIWILQMAI